jgi:branched-chain amino acid transport system ATP-binding protein
MPMPAATLEIKGLVAGYGNTRIIDGIDMSVKAGSRIAILGRNGMGKSTFFATMAGQTRQFAGQIELSGQSIERLGSTERAMVGLGYVPQSRDVFPTLTVEENLLVGLKGRSNSAIEEAYSLFPRLKERRSNLGNQLSGGEQQMLTTARTILGKPSVLLLDEPLEGLAPVICEQLMEVFSTLAAQGEMTILLIEQRIQAALEFAEDVYIFERGRIAYRGTPDQIKNDNELVERLLGVGKI